MFTLDFSDISRIPHITFENFKNRHDICQKIREHIFKAQKK